MDGENLAGLSIPVLYFRVAEHSMKILTSLLGEGTPVRHTREDIIFSRNPSFLRHYGVAPYQLLREYMSRS